MNKFLLALVAVACLLTSVGCTSETVHGDCVGFDDSENRDPALKYEINTKNAVIGVLLVETLVAPIYIGLTEIYCPTGRVTPVVTVPTKAQASGEGEGEGEGESASAKRTIDFSNTGGAQVVITPDAGPATVR